MADPARDDPPPDDATHHDPHAVPAWLLGRWRLLRAEAALDFAPGVRMEFLPGGRLRYTIDAGGRPQVIALVYRVDGDMLRTDNPSNPHAVATRFSRGEGGVLVFDFSGARAWFVRES
jgi:hypothetical protein